jgi:hypothetical protein
LNFTSVAFAAAAAAAAAAACQRGKQKRDTVSRTSSGFQRNPSLDTDALQLEFQRKFTNFVIMCQLLLLSVSLL